MAATANTSNTMEVTVMDTGDLPSNTVMAFHTGSIRRHAQLEQNKAVNLAYATGGSPIRVDLMSQVGSCTFDLKPDQDIYEIPIKSPRGEDVTLKVRVRDANSAEAQADRTKREAVKDGDEGNAAPGSPSRKLQTALMMRSYLDQHDVLRQMQELLHDMVGIMPEDPVSYMISKLEEVSDVSQAIVVDGSAAPGQASGEAKKQEKNDSDSDEDDDADDAPDPLPPPGYANRGPRQSVSAEAYGAFNERKAFVKKVIEKTSEQKARIEEILKISWMFRDFSAENMKVIVDAMIEKMVEPGTKLISIGDPGEVMWVIEEGTIECFKPINGEEKLVKTCVRGDLFGELALLYNTNRAANVTSKDKCVLWEVDRDTFTAICFEAASKAPKPSYEGFAAPGGEAANEEKTEEKKDEQVSAPDNDKKKDEVKDKKEEEEDADSGSEGEEVAVRQPGGKPPGRREGVSAEAMGDDDNWTPPKYDKTPEERQQLSDIIKTSKDSKLHMLFGTVSTSVFEQIIDAMFLKKVAIGEKVMEQGGVADNFYIVKLGKFDIIVKKGEDPPKKVFEAGVSFAFGELALLYNAPRSATIEATEESEVWCLDRSAFQNLVVRSSAALFKSYSEFLSGVDIFHVLNANEQASLAEVLEEEEFEDDEAILQQGEKDDKMFILHSGNAVACIQGPEGEIEVMQYSKGDYFGEIALLLGEPRKASVYAVGPCKCLYISRETFVRILGPLTSVLERNIGKYAKYSAAIEKSNAEEKVASKEENPDDNQDFVGGVNLEAKSKVVNRKRVKPTGGNQSQMDGVKAHEVNKELPEEEGEPQSLADKVAMDFKKPVLVTPAEQFLNKDGQIMVYGGLVLGQKFEDDKAMHWNLTIPPVVQGDDDTFCWNGMTKLKHLTNMAVICQKGQKSAADPTPNQDNYFVHHIAHVTMYGICDGHGPFGHLVSFRLVQSLPHFLARSSNFGKDWALALKEAFLAAHEDLETFCGEHNINIQASGAAGSVMVLDEQTVHIAFIGDARIMLGSWNRRDSRMIFCTSDHKPNLPEEKARLEAAGSEVREVDPDNHRIYIPGTSFPGLTMSRAFGDTACNGVLREPEYHKFLMQPTDEWYAIVASDGIWEFMEGTEVCNMTSKKLRLKGPRETLHFLVNAARKRWKHCCGDYCDDITGILVQWNTHDKKDEKANHSLCVQRQTIAGVRAPA